MKHIIQYIVLALFVLSTVVVLYCTVTGSCIHPDTVTYYATMFQQFVALHYVPAVILYILLYALCILILFPLLAPFTIMGGYLFGTVLGVVYCCIASLLGSLISFALFRFVLADTIQRRYAHQLAWFNVNIVQEGAAHYLLILHFLLVPFSVINMGAALTGVSWWTFSWTTVVGSIPISVVYAFAGQQLNALKNGPILSFQILGMLALLVGVVALPLVIKQIQKRLTKNTL